VVDDTGCFAAPDKPTADGPYVSKPTIPIDKFHAWIRYLTLSRSIEHRKRPTNISLHVAAPPCAPEARRSVKTLSSRGADMGSSNINARSIGRAISLAGLLAAAFGVSLAFVSVSASAHVSVGIGFVAAPVYAAPPVYYAPPPPPPPVYYAPPPPPAVVYQTVPAPVVYGEDWREREWREHEWRERREWRERQEYERRRAYYGY
jgi:hypothetical protein